MKKHWSRIISLVLVGAFILSGCAQMSAISDEDEDKIALYSANLIGRFNKKQKRGIVPVVMRPQEEETEEEEMDDSDSGFPLDPFDVNAPVSDGGVSSLGESLSIPGVEFSYTGADISQDYGIDGGFLITPLTGNAFLAVHFKATNTTEDAVTCDVRSRGFNFTATLGDTTSAVERTPLADNLATYNSVIAAGESADLSLLFQFPASYLGDLSGLVVSCVKDGVKYEITL